MFFSDHTGLIVGLFISVVLVVLVVAVAVVFLLYKHVKAKRVRRRKIDSEEEDVAVPLAEFENQRNDVPLEHQRNDVPIGPQQNDVPLGPQQNGVASRTSASPRDTPDQSEPAGGARGGPYGQPESGRYYDGRTTHRGLPVDNPESYTRYGRY